MVYLYLEEFFKTEIKGKTYDPKKEHGVADKYSKFAERVIKPNADTIEFSGFAPLLNRIVAVLQNYEARCLD